MCVLASSIRVGGPKVFGAKVVIVESSVTKSHNGRRRPGAMRHPQLDKLRASLRFFIFYNIKRKNKANTILSFFPRPIEKKNKRLFRLTNGRVNEFAFGRNKTQPKNKETHTHKFLCPSDIMEKDCAPINHGNELETDADKDGRPSGQ
jgi:hypothetical protein